SGRGDGPGARPGLQLEVGGPGHRHLDLARADVVEYQVDRVPDGHPGREVIFALDGDLHRLRAGRDLQHGVALAGHRLTEFGLREAAMVRGRRGPCGVRADRDGLHGLVAERDVEPGRAVVPADRVDRHERFAVGLDDDVRAAFRAVEGQVAGLARGPGGGEAAVALAGVRL